MHINYTVYVHISVILRGFKKGRSFFYLLILLYCTIFFLFLFFSSYNLTVCCNTAKLMTCRENPAKIPVWGKKSARVYHCLYSSTEQLKVALRTYIFLWFGLNKEKSIHTLPLRSVPVLSLIPPPRLLSQFDY
jgi:hypothetical protein